MLIQVRLEALTGEFSTDLDRAAKDAERAFKRMERESKQALASVGKIVAGTATAAAAGFAVMVKSAVANADELGKLSQKVGIAVEDLSTLAGAAKLSDIELNTLDEALVKLTRSIALAGTGNAQLGKAFASLGIDVRDSEGRLKDTEQVLQDVIKSFSGLPDGPLKTASAIDILGKSAANLVPFLSQGEEAIARLKDEVRKFGGETSSEFVAAAGEFDTSLKNIGTSLDGISRSIVARALPTLNQWADAVERAAQKANAFISAQSSEDGLLHTISVLERQLSTGARGGNKFLEDELEGTRLKLNELRSEGGALKSLLPDLNREFAALGTGAQEKLGKAFEDAEKAAKDAKAAAKSLADEQKRAVESATQSLAGLEQSLRQQVATFGLAESAALEYRLTMGDLSDEVALAGEKGQKLAAAVLDQARALEAIQKASEDAEHIRELARAYDGAAAAAKSYVDEISREGQRTLAAFDQTPAQRRFSTGQFQIDDTFRAEREQLERQLAQGDLEKAEYDKRITALKGFYEMATAEHAKYFGLIEEKQKDFTTSFNNSINEYIDATGNVGEALGETLVGAIDEAIAATSRLAAEAILFGEGGKEAIYQLTRSIATELLSALIRVGIQLLINKTLLSALGGAASGGAGGSGPGGLTGFSGGAFASGGYTGDDPRHKVAGVVHGQEFVINPEATRKNRGLLEAINDGTYSMESTNIPRASTQSLKPATTLRVVNVPDKSYIKDYLMGSEGDEVFVNWVGRNGARLRNAVSSG